MPDDDYLKTRTVADALGLSVSTIKRWVDCGTIQAVRTVGKHRLIPRSEALRVSAELGMDPSGLNMPPGLPSGELVSLDGGTVEKLAQLLREGKSRQARSLIVSVYASGCGAAALADELIRPAMARIGHAWMVGAIDVYQEHRASHIVVGILMEMIDRLVSQRSAVGPLAVGATPEGDPYILPLLLGELVLRELGWDVRGMGVNLPLRSLANAVVSYRPKLVFLPVAYLADPDRFVREYRAFHRTAAEVNAAVVLGGQALDQGLRSQLVYSAFGDRMVHLAEFVRQVSPPGAGIKATHHSGRARVYQPFAGPESSAAH